MCSEEGQPLPQRRVGGRGRSPPVRVARERVARHLAALVQAAEVRPRRRVALVQLDGTDVRLQRVHRLILLLIEYPVE